MLLIKTLDALLAFPFGNIRVPTLDLELLLLQDNKVKKVLPSKKNDNMAKIPFLQTKYIIS